jgi:actin-related protein 8
MPKGRVKALHREYLKRDDQILPLRLLQEERRNRMTAKAKDRDRQLAQANLNEPPQSGADMDMDDDLGMDDTGELLTGQDALGSKVIVIHLGSQNLRIGLASDALPKTVPMVIARKCVMSESEEDGGEPSPKRLKSEDGNEVEPEKMFGEEVRRLLYLDEVCR